MGESYGGYMTMWAVGRTDRFAAAIAENGISDLRTISSQGGGPPFWHSEMQGTPWSEPERYAARSPLSHVARMTTPLLLVHAELDGNCPIDQSEVLHASLRALDRDVTFVRIPGEGHLVNLYGRPSRRRARQSIVDAFLAAHLGP
jgi:dipeptidyl aminopeptidase/acylaminoacyl peptidase